MPKKFNWLRWRAAIGRKTDSTGVWRGAIVANHVTGALLFIHASAEFRTPF